MIIAYYYIGNLMDMRESKQSHIERQNRKGQ